MQAFLNAISWETILKNVRRNKFIVLFGALIILSGIILDRLPTVDSLNRGNYYRQKANEFDSCLKKQDKFDSIKLDKYNKLNTQNGIRLSPYSELVSRVQYLIATWNLIYNTAEIISIGEEMTSPARFEKAENKINQYKYYSAETSRKQKAAKDNLSIDTVFIQYEREASYKSDSINNWLQDSLPSFKESRDIIVRGNPWWSSVSFYLYVIGASILILALFTFINIKIPLLEYILCIRTFTIIGGLMLVLAWYLDSIVKEKLKKDDFNFRELIHLFDGDMANNNELITTHSVLDIGLHSDSTKIKDSTYFPSLRIALFYNTVNLIGSNATTISVGEKMANIVEDSAATFSAFNCLVMVDYLRHKYSEYSSSVAVAKYQDSANNILSQIGFSLQTYLPTFRNKRDEIDKAITENKENESSLYIYLYALGTVFVFIDLLLSGFREYNKDSRPKTKSPT
jgi:hypothetical protein